MTDLTITLVMTDDEVMERHMALMIPTFWDMFVADMIRIQPMTNPTGMIFKFNPRRKDDECLLDVISLPHGSANSKN